MKNGWIEACLNTSSNELTLMGSRVGSGALGRGHVAHRWITSRSARERLPRRGGGFHGGGGIRCHISSATLQRWFVIPAAIAGVRCVPSARERLSCSVQQL